MLRMQSPITASSSGLLAWLTRYLDIFIPSDEDAGPIERLRSRSLGIMLNAALGAVALQLINFLSFDYPMPHILGMFVALLGYVQLTFFLRRGNMSPVRSGLAMAVIPMIVGAFEIGIGRSPVTPYVIWYPLCAFLTLIINGPRWGLFSSCLVIGFSVFHLLYTMNLPIPEPVSGDASAEAYIRRFDLALLLLFLMTCVLIHYYLYLFDQTLRELDALEAGRSQRKRMSALASFGFGVAKDLEKSLFIMEGLGRSLRQGKTLHDHRDLRDRLEAMRAEITQMSSITERYLVLSAKQDRTQEPVDVSKVISFITKFHESIGSATTMQVEAPAVSEHRLVSSSAARLLVLLLCSGTTQVMGEDCSGVLVLSVRSQDQFLLFTLRYSVSLDLHQKAGLREMVVDVQEALQAVGGHAELRLEGSVSLGIRVPELRSATTAETLGS